MFSLWGEIVVGTIIFGIVIIIFIGRKFFSNMKYSKMGGIELSRDRRCSDHPCDENKLYTILLQINNNRTEINKISEDTIDKQYEYAEQRFEEIEQKVRHLLSKTEQRLAEKVSIHRYLFFTLSLREILDKIQNLYKKIVKKKIFNYEIATEEEFMQFKRQTVLDIPKMIQNNLPLVPILNTRLFAEMMKDFDLCFYKEFSPIIEDIANMTRKFAIEGKSKRELLEIEYKNILDHYMKELLYERRAK
jgi:hypothetical protein